MKDFAILDADIIEVIDLYGFIKTNELIVKLSQENFAIFESEEITNSIYRLVKENKIGEIEYTHPDNPEKIKSVFFSLKLTGLKSSISISS